MPKSIKLIIAILLPMVVGGFSGFLTANSINDWYTTLHQPSFNPPNWVFGPVWTTLYLLMGISLYRIWILPVSAERNFAIGVFFGQMILNFFWSLIFFRWHLIGTALAEIILMWVMIASMIHLFKKLDKAAGLMNVPYLLWVTFATVLNAAYFVLN
ncbi:MAG: TspO/MBR family protein [Bacteroidota bacterium]|jgi:benzodiazapine receptor